MPGRPAAGQDHPGDPVALDRQLGDPAGHHPDPGVLAGGQEGFDQGAVVDLVVAGGEDAAADAWGEAGLELAALAAAEALDLEAAAELELVEVLEGGVVVGVAGHG